MRRHRFRTAVAVAAAACAVGGATACASGGATDEPATAVRDVRNRLTAEEIAASGVPTAYDAVDRLRRQWKRDMSAPGDAAVSVYLDNRRIGGLDALRNIGAAEVRELQYVSGREAEQRWGPEARGGAIIVLRR